eukprot:scaffold117024_cov35-Attheya_sp.AAC.2
MDRCVRHRRGVGRRIRYRCGPGGQSCSCGEDPWGEDPVSEVWPPAKQFPSRRVRSFLHSRASAGTGTWYQTCRLA